MLHVLQQLYSSSLYIRIQIKNIVYKPKISNEVLINPFMGWAPDAKYKDYIQPHSLVYANLYWSDLEPSKGIYDFKNIEKKI